MPYSPNFVTAFNTSRARVTTSLVEQINSHAYGYLFMNNINKILVTFGQDPVADSVLRVGKRAYDLQCVIDLAGNIEDQLNAVV